MDPTAVLLVEFSIKVGIQALQDRAAVVHDAALRLPTMIRHEEKALPGRANEAVTAEAAYATACSWLTDDARGWR